MNMNMNNNSTLRFHQAHNTDNKNNTRSNIFDWKPKSENKSKRPFFLT